jgi:adenine phosphoribosyltransferase
MEVARGDFAPGGRVPVVDDVLATVGALEASLRVVRDAGAEAAAVGVLLELGFLKGRSRLDPY